MRIIFNDLIEVNAIMVNGISKFYQNAQRDSLEFIFKKTDYPFDTLDRYFIDKTKTVKITLVDDITGTQYIYEDYTIRVSMILAPAILAPATSTSPEVTEERISVVMAQKTYMEKQIEQLLGA